MLADTVLRKHFYIGLDLGRDRNYTGVVALETADVEVGERSLETYTRKRQIRHWVRLVERIPLDTPYTEIAPRIRRITCHDEVRGGCTVVVDATGLGAPVMDMLRRAELGCTVVGVTITGGETASWDGKLWHVPKKDLLEGLVVLLEEERLGVSRHLETAGLLVEEMLAMRVKVKKSGAESYGARDGEQDDLALALSLACWRAEQARPQTGFQGRIL